MQETGKRQGEKLKNRLREDDKDSDGEGERGTGCMEEEMGGRKEEELIV